MHQDTVNFSQVITLNRATDLSGSATGCRAAAGRIGASALLRTFAAAVLVAAALAGKALSAGATATSAPVSEVKVVLDKALAILRDSKTPLPQRREELRTIVAAHFDFNEMSRSALGYHWRYISPAQRSEFVSVFTKFIEDTYLNKIQYYSGQDIEIGRTIGSGPGYAEVRTKVVKRGSEEQPLALNFELKQTAGRWLIYDVTVDQISIVANYRNQFNRVFNEKGFGTLMSDLKRKQEQLAASLGHA